MLGVGEAVLMKLVVATTSPEETSPGGMATDVAGETDERGELVTVMTIGVDVSVGGVLVGITTPSEEIGSGVIIVA